MPALASSPDTLSWQDAGSTATKNATRDEWRHNQAANIARAD